MREFFSHSGYSRPSNMRQFFTLAGRHPFGGLADEFDYSFDREPPLSSFVEFVPLRFVTKTNSDPREVQHVAQSFFVNLGEAPLGGHESVG
jgi:hypothetical protein